MTEENKISTENTKIKKGEVHGTRDGTRLFIGKWGRGGVGRRMACALGTSAVTIKL